MKAELLTAIIVDDHVALTFSLGFGSVTLRNQAAALALAATTFLYPVIAAAECGAVGTDVSLGCMLPMDVPARPADMVDAAVMSSASASASSPAVDVGQILPRAEYSIIINADYYGLPAVSDGWVYMRVGQDAYRVDWKTHQVLERVTEQAAANF